MGTPRSEFEDIGATLKTAAAALREADVDFLLAGSLASWARGGPETSHDLDFVVRPEDAERALDALVGAGMTPERPPEEWLVKAWNGDVLVDLIHHPQGLVVDDEVMRRGEDVSVLGVTLRAMALEDVMATKLLALGEHNLDFEGHLQIARALRERVDWEEVRRRTADSPYARAFFTLVEGLGVVADREEARLAGAGARG